MAINFFFQRYNHGKDYLCITGLGTASRLDLSWDAWLERRRRRRRRRVSAPSTPNPVTTEAPTTTTEPSTTAAPFGTTEPPITIDLDLVDQCEG